MPVSHSSVFKPLSQAVSENLRAGDSVAFEGFTHLIPHAAAHEVIRQGIGELTLIRMTPDVVYDQMIGAGVASKLNVPALPSMTVTVHFN